MSSTRLSWLFVATAIVSLDACTCARAPVQNLLKAEGEPCEKDDECESVLCDQLPGKEKVCFRKCAVGCKPGEVCTSLAVNDRFVCVPELPGLCQGCELNIDCPYPGDKCLEIGGSKVCARDCTFDGQCPSSYRCADGTDTSGNFVTKQCQPASGTCECVASSAGQTLPCEESNSFGRCVGVQTCRPPSGYDACSAPVPSAEFCNGRDDDCDGMSDEDLGDTSCGIGECRRTVSNCANGAAQTCTAGDPATEVCDDKDNDCDGVPDDGIDKMTSVAHCGVCNNACARAHATPVCDLGMCRIGVCDPGWTNADGIDANGCEYPCAITNGGVESCDGLDNNCDGRVDEGFMLQSDPTNCGICGRVCNVASGNIATYACIGGQCAIGTCNTNFNDCDQGYGTGCEVNSSTSLVHCGSCNNPCTTPNATAACVGGMCTVGSCTSPWEDCDGQVPNGCEVNTDTNVDRCGSCTNVCPTRNNATRTCSSGSCGFTCNAGWIDLDGLAANGCEYGCVPTAGPDDPDDAYTDSNCDGVDGDDSRAIYVATNGNNSNPGTRALPKQTVQAGIAAASTARPHVYVSNGTYTEPHTLVNGISVFGGYSRTNNWQRSAANLTTLRNDAASSNAIVGVTGSGITSATTLGWVTIRAVDTTAANTSTYGVHCTNCTGLTLHGTNIYGGSAGAGSAGAAGVSTGRGYNGYAGNPGTCDEGHGSRQSAVGASDCGRVGGYGGRGGPAGDNAGEAGGPGTSGAPGGAAGGGCSRTCGGCTGGDGQSGQPGGAGSAGQDALGGSGGGVIASYYIASSGGNGTDGTNGNGGGGGGGGGGQGGLCVVDGGGNSGGSGGGGGCLGTRGSGGLGGGSSFALFMVNSSGLRLVNTNLFSGSGGTGGAGGSGGAGGVAGGGGLGATACDSEVGVGGNGGAGGAGGRGGHGGGGAGGLSYALYRVNSLPGAITNVTFSHGSGGTGGASPAGATYNGSAGASGDVN